MIDDFNEEVVISRNQKQLNAFYAAATVFTILFALDAVVMLFFLFVSFNVFMLALCVISAALAVFLFVFRDRFKTEYEYTFTDNALDVAKVLRRAKRKELGSVLINEVSACGYVKGEQAPRFLNMQGAVRRDWFLNRDADLFFFYTVKGDKKSVTVVEPSPELVALIRRSLPMGVYRD